MKLFLRNITYSLTYGKYKYIVFYCVIAFISAAISLQINSIGSNSIGVFFELLQDNGYIKQIGEFRVPFYWEFTQFFVMFLIGDFLFKDLEKNRIYLLLRSQSKLHYIVSKICWIVVQNILIFTGLFLVIYLVSSTVLGDFSFGESTYFNNVIEPKMVIKISPEQLVLRIMTGFIITSIVLSSIQLLCIQFIPPIMAFLLVIIISSISLLLDSKWLPGIHSMILKQDIFNLQHNLTLNFSLLYSAALYALITILTLYFFKKKDIL